MLNVVSPTREDLGGVTIRWKRREPLPTLTPHPFRFACHPISICLYPVLFLIIPSKSCVFEENISHVQNWKHIQSRESQKEATWCNWAHGDWHIWHENFRMHRIPQKSRRRPELSSSLPTARKRAQQAMDIGEVSALPQPVAEIYPHLAAARGPHSQLCLKRVMERHKAPRSFPVCV